MLDIGKAFNLTFKPWQAEKIAKGFMRVGQVMDVLGVALDIGMQLKDDYDAEAHRRELKAFRQNVRSEFNGFAGELLDFGRSFVEGQLESALGQVITDLDEKIEIIRSTNARQNEKAAALRKILADCRTLIQEIHQG